MKCVYKEIRKNTFRRRQNGKWKFSRCYQCRNFPDKSYFDICKVTYIGTDLPKYIARKRLGMIVYETATAKKKRSDIYSKAETFNNFKISTRYHERQKA